MKLIGRDEGSYVYSIPEGERVAVVWAMDVMAPVYSDTLFLEGFSFYGGYAFR